MAELYHCTPDAETKTPETTDAETKTPDAETTDAAKTKSKKVAKTTDPAKSKSKLRVIYTNKKK